LYNLLGDTNSIVDLKNIYIYKIQKKKKSLSVKFDIKYVILIEMCYFYIHCTHSLTLSKKQGLIWSHSMLQASHSMLQSDGTHSFNYNFPEQLS